MLNLVVCIGFKGLRKSERYWENLEASPWQDSLWRTRILQTQTDALQFPLLHHKSSQFNEFDHRYIVGWNDTGRFRLLSAIL